MLSIFSWIGCVSSHVGPSQVERQLARLHRTVSQGIPVEVDQEFQH